MNKARVAEAARGFIQKLISPHAFAHVGLIVDFCVSYEHRRVIILNPSTYMTHRKDGGMDGTKEWIYGLVSSL